MNKAMCRVGFGLMLLLVVGCGSRYVPVSGTVVYPDGTPARELKGGAVEFQAVDEPISARGSIDEEGRFTITTENPGDGALPGKHKVVVTPPPNYLDAPRPMLLDPKYGQYETSKLEVVVESGKALQITVERPKR